MLAKELKVWFMVDNWAVRIIMMMIIAIFISLTLFRDQYKNWQPFLPSLVIVVVGRWVMKLFFRIYAMPI